MVLRNERPGSLQRLISRRAAGGDASHPFSGGIADAGHFHFPPLHYESDVVGRPGAL